MRSASDVTPLGDAGIQLLFMGLGVMAARVLWQKHELALGARLRGWLPAAWRELLEAYSHD